MSILNFINFIGLNFAVALNAFLIISWLTNYKIHSFSKTILSLFVVFCSHIIITETLLGSLNALSNKNLSIITYSISLILIFSLLKKTIKNLNIPNPTKEYPNLFAAILIFSPIVFFLFVKAFNTTLQIPLEYDSVAYHLPFIAEWLQTGTLNNLYYSAFAGPISYYPSNYELLDLWSFLPFHNDYFANLINFPLFAILGITIWNILRNFEIEKNIALVATAIPFYMPIFLHQAGLPLVDLFFTLMFALSIYFLQEISKTKNKTEFLLFGLSIGLFIGTKYLGVIYGSTLLFLFMLITGYQKSLSFKKATLTFAGLLSTGSFFYIRNWINSENPLFPVNLNIAGREILTGYSGAGVNEMLGNTSLLANLHTFSEIKEKIISFFYITGPHGLIAILLPLFIGIYLLGIPFHKKNKNTPLLIIGIASLVYFYLYLKAPYTYKDFFSNIRYAMPLFILETIGVGILAQKLKYFKKNFYTVSTIIFTYSFLFLIFSPPQALDYTNKIFINYSILLSYKTPLIIALIGFATFLASISLFLYQTKKKKLKLLITSSLLLISLISATYFFKFSIIERETKRDYWATNYFGSDQNLMDIIHASEWLNKNAPTTNIAYSGFNFHYYLYGRNFARKVDYININECTDCRYVDYKNSENSIRRDPNYINWIYNLKTNNKNYLVINPASTQGVRNYEFEWANEHPQNFEKVFTSNDTHIYKIHYDQEIN